MGGGGSSPVYGIEGPPLGLMERPLDVVPVEDDVSRVKGVVHEFVAAALAEYVHELLGNVLLDGFGVHVLHGVKEVRYPLLDVPLELLEVAVKIGETPYLHHVFKRPRLEIAAAAVTPQFLHLPSSPVEILRISLADSGLILSIKYTVVKL